LKRNVTVTSTPNPRPTQPVVPPPVRVDSACQTDDAYLQNSVLRELANTYAKHVKAINDVNDAGAIFISSDRRKPNSVPVAPPEPVVFDVGDGPLRRQAPCNCYVLTADQKLDALQHICSDISNLCPYRLSHHALKADSAYVFYTVSEYDDGTPAVNFMLV